MITKFKTMLAVSLGAACLILPALAGGTDAAADKNKKQEKQKATQAQPVSGGAGMVVSIDPNRSGQASFDQEPKLSEEMRAELGKLINTSSEGLVEERMPDGTVIVNLQGRFQSAVVASIGKDGKIHTNCVSTDPNHKHEHHHATEATKKQETTEKPQEKK